ncbi:hypothetical protein ABZV91_10810 [Nocardia sp. NPDC004568]|uniref:hypothetical protein n=1 Tax=Nocardia sp. NPDC004568 TaxID=3154551 RepID=UPI0033A8FF5F
MKNYPGPLRGLCDLDEFGTGIGFLDVELFSMLLPTLFLVFAIGRGARAIPHTSGCCRRGRRIAGRAPGLLSS